MSIYVTSAFWKATAERAFKTLAQSVVALLTAGATGLLDVDFGQVASVPGLAAGVSVATSIASAQIGGDGPSLGAEELPAQVPPADQV